MPEPLGYLAVVNHIVVHQGTQKSCLKLITAERHLGNTAFLGYDPAKRIGDRF